MSDNVSKEWCRGLFSAKKKKIKPCQEADAHIDGLNKRSLDVPKWVVSLYEV